MSARLAQQIAFLVEADKLKSIVRRTPLVDSSRLENSNAVDRPQPLLQNEHSGGGSWRGQVLADAQILRRMAPIRSAMPDVWPHVLEVIESYCRAGVLQRTPGQGLI